MYNHILSIILFTPLVGAALLLLVPKENKDADPLDGATSLASSASWFRCRWSPGSGR